MNEYLCTYICKQCACIVFITFNLNVGLKDYRQRLSYLELGLIAYKL